MGWVEVFGRCKGPLSCIVSDAGGQSFVARVGNRHVTRGTQIEVAMGASLHQLGHPNRAKPFSEHNLVSRLHRQGFFG